MIWRLCEACNVIHVEDEWINPHIWPINGTVLDGATCPGCLSTRYVDTGEILLEDVVEYGHER